MLCDRHITLSMIKHILIQILKYLNSNEILRPHNRIQNVLKRQILTHSIAKYLRREKCGAETKTSFTPIF